MTTAGERASIERIDFDDLDGGRTVDYRDVAFVASLLVLGAAYYYYTNEIPDHEPLPVVGGWDPILIDWVFFGSLLVFGFYVVVPTVRNWRLTASYLAEFRGNWAAILSLGWLTLFFVLGLFKPVVAGTPGFNSLLQPPFGIGIDALFVGTCEGAVSNGLCYGSLAHPLGTSGNGRDVLQLTIAGMWTALEVSLITATIIVPLGVAVGTVTAYVGGWVDEVVMRYVDVQQTIPAIFIYMVAQFVFGPSLMLIVVVFGLLNWGDLARLVRSEALQKREAEFVMAARSAGAGRLQVVRDHIVPNVSSTVLTSVALQLPMLIIVEATLSYLQLGDPRVFSWGNSITVVLAANANPTTFWWAATFPILALVATVVSMNVLGSALQDVLDPRREA